MIKKSRKVRKVSSFEESNPSHPPHCSYSFNGNNSEFVSSLSDTDYVISVKTVFQISNKSAEKHYKCITKQAIFMAALMDMAVECLRPLVQTTTWDLCVLWKLGDDPTSFIQWRGCCCSGGNDGTGNTKREYLVRQCRDVYSQHSVRTLACQKLSKLPSSLPLYSGIHGEVVLSNKPKWLLEEAGTQVLVPIEGGLVELFSAKQVPKNHQTIKFIMYCFEEEIMSAQPEYQLFLDESFISRQKIPSFVLDSSYYRTSLGSGPISCHTSPETSSATYPGINTFVVQNQKVKPHKSKNLMSERSRRERIKQNILTLRSIVPNISKMDRAATITDACDYIEELQNAQKMYADELKSLTEECDKYNAEQEADSRTKNKEQVKVDVQVSQIGASDFSVKIIYRQRCYSFLRLMEAMESLGLRVSDANVTTSNGLVLNIFQVQAVCKLMNLKNLKDSLSELICQEGERKMN